MLKIIEHSNISAPSIPAQIPTLRRVAADLSHSATPFVAVIFRAKFFSWHFEGWVMEVVAPRVRTFAASTWNEEHSIAGEMTRDIGEDRKRPQSYWETEVRSPPDNTIMSSATTGWSKKDGNICFLCYRKTIDGIFIILRMHVLRFMVISLTCI